MKYTTHHNVESALLLILCNEMVLSGEVLMVLLLH